LESLVVYPLIDPGAGLILLYSRSGTEPKAIPEYLQGSSTSGPGGAAEEVEVRTGTSPIPSTMPSGSGEHPSPIKKLHDTFSGSFVFYQQDIVGGDFTGMNMSENRFMIVCADSTGTVCRAFMSMIGTT
jgi:hypothetical protein